MPATLEFNNLENHPRIIDLRRDDCVVISGNTPNPTAMRKAFAKLKDLRSKLPMNAVDTVAEVRKIRDGGSRA